VLTLVRASVAADTDTDVDAAIHAAISLIQILVGTQTFVPPANAPSLRTAA